MISSVICDSFEVSVFKTFLKYGYVRYFVTDFSFNCTLVREYNLCDISSLISVEFYLLLSIYSISVKLSYVLEREGSVESSFPERISEFFFKAFARHLASLVD